jgi:PEGA domain
VVAGLGLAGWLRGRRSAPHPMIRPPTAAKVSPPPARTTPSPAATPLRKTTPLPEPAIRPAPLRVEADVADASVFVDRRFMGKAPLDLRDLAPGPHRLNVSAEGYALHAEEVEVGEEPRTISVRFNEVRLDESLTVIHKHGVGSCQGVLRAKPEGLGFEATSGKDSFRVPLTDLGKFEVDYLKKTLRVTLRGGRSYNFTVEGASADPLLVFQQKVEAARKRL